MALTDNLISYWKFDEASGNAADAVGSNTLTNTNTATYEAGLINNAGKLVAASSQYFKKTTPASMPTSDMSIQIWFKPATQPSNDEFDLVSHFDGPSNNKCFLLSYVDSAGTKTFQFATSSDGANNHNSNIAGTLTTSSWAHIVSLYTAASHTNQIYINGSSIGSGDVTDTSIFSSTVALQIGARNNTPAGLTNGDVDEAAIWSRVLTGAEITQLYNSGAGLQYPFSGGGGGAISAYKALMGAGI